MGGKNAKSGRVSGYINPCNPGLLPFSGGPLGPFSGLFGGLGGCGPCGKFWTKRF